MPSMRDRFRPLAQEAMRDQQTPLAYLAALLEAKVTERAERRERRRLIDARFPLTKRLEDFRFEENRKSPRPQSPRSRRAAGSMTASQSSSEPARPPAASSESESAAQCETGPTTPSTWEVKNKACRDAPT